MVVRFDPDGHRRFDSFGRYHVPELEAVTGSRIIQILNENAEVCFQGELSQLSKALGDFIKLNTGSRDGMSGIFTCPADVKFAMKSHGLIDTPQDAYKIFAPAFKSVVKALSAFSVAQTTVPGLNGGRDKVHIPVGFYVAVVPANNTRSGEAEVSLDFFMFKRAPDLVSRKMRAIDFRYMMIGQAAAQSAGNKALGFILRDKGILCVPHGKSITAIGYKAQTQGTEKLKAAGVGPGQAGPAETAAAARSIAKEAGKKVVPWPEAWKKLTGTIDYIVTRKVSGLLTRLDEHFQARLAKGCVIEAFGFCRDSGMARFSEGTVKATAMQLATPHVKPEIFEKVWAQVAADPSPFGVAEVALHPTGHRTFAPVARAAAEMNAKGLLEAHAKRNIPGLDTRDVIRAMVGKGLTTDQISDAAELCSGGGVRWASAYKDSTLQHAVTAYERAGKNVYVVGDGKLAKQLGVACFSAAGLVDSATRTPHLRALWAGLRERGPFGDWLGAAEAIRSARPRISLKVGDLVVLSPQQGLADAAGVEAVMKLARQVGAKVVMAGQGADQFRSQTLGQSRGPRP